MTGGNSRAIRHIHTLGPPGTNLEAAAYAWLAGRDGGEVSLYPSLESALDVVPHQSIHAIMACAVYPDLHTLVFSNLKSLEMVDSFVMPTHNMVLASRTADEPRLVATHPAPAGLVPSTARRRIVLSNSQAAIDCHEGRVDACITTIVAARERHLIILEDFGPVPMVFTVHQLIEAA